MMVVFSSFFSVHAYNPLTPHIFEAESQRNKIVTEQLVQTKMTINFYPLIFSAFLGALYFRRICEGQSLTLNCPKFQVIDILSASYGRTQRGLCGRHDRNTNCHAGTSMRVARFECQQQQRCVLFAKNSAFGDPCKGTSKYLEVSSKLIY